MAIITQFKQYGFKNSFIRAVKLVLRACGVNVETYMFYTQEIKTSLLKQSNISPNYKTEKLNYNSYESSRGLKFDNLKLNLFKERLNDNEYLAYGVFDGEILIYSSWISTRQDEMSLQALGLKLNPDEGLLLDIETHPSYRRQGLHNYMNIYCLERIKELGKDKAVVLVLKENVPARKSQERSGFKKSKKISCYKIWGMQKIRINNI
ncbi:GNAT family N-acetyltransferase [Winogradskyella sp. UBA3174]|uniref:GNAT family N-acetyltransferase n=1 Tax=Winogradskyella sp. UBA3174 TaxID=1947785 RepID=UPI0025FBF9DC|nr:hypothetical protein [Winogradskyella sp. UBA3174]|tara:strand:+ start:49375 stop:49995 length:621 start_codon:yes stop_codon:yes gene_type:complete